MGQGRQPGSLGKSTLLRRDNLITAVEVCRSGAISPPEILREGMLLIRNIALAPVAGAKSIAEQNALLASLPEHIKDKIVKRVMAACTVAHQLMEYGYPKLARVEHTGADGGAIQHEHVGVVERVLVGTVIEGTASKPAADDHVH